MFVNINPSLKNKSESVCSLNFAKRCKSVKLGKVRKHTSVKPSATNEVNATTPRSPSRVNNSFSSTTKNRSPEKSRRLN